MTKKKIVVPRPVPRRRVLEGFGAALGAAAFGCGGTEDTYPNAEVTGAGGSGSGGWAGEGGGGGGAAAGGGGGGAVDHCAATSSMSPEELLAPIRTIVVLCMENRSFDHYLGSLRLHEGKPVNGLGGDERNPAPDGSQVGVFKLDDYTPEDPPHNWDAAHAQWNLGANDGFVKAHAGPSQAEVMGYHVRDQLTALYALADAGAICDRWFCSLLGPTWPNRFYLHGATSKGIKSNSPALGFTSVFELLKDAGVSHRNYFHDVPWCSGAYFKTSGINGIERFFSDAAAGTLPAFSIIDPQFFGAGANDDHPDHDVQLGQVLMASIYSALAQSPQWNECLFVITYDEHGGFFDHVAPPTKIDDDPEFSQLGFRVPSLVLGPYARRGCAVSTPLEHVSVMKTLVTRFGIPALNARVSASNDLSSCIDPTTIGAPQPPVVLPQMAVSMSALAARARARGRAQLGGGHVEHPELWRAAEEGVIPRYLDRRGDGDAIARRVLEEAARLGVVRLRG